MVDIVRASRCAGLPFSVCATLSTVGAERVGREESACVGNGRSRVVGFRQLASRFIVQDLTSTARM